MDVAAITVMVIFTLAPAARLPTAHVTVPPGPALVPEHVREVVATAVK